MFWKTSLKWGLYLGLSVSLATQILTWLGLGLTNWFVVLTYLLVILCTFICCWELKKANQGQLSFTMAFLSILIVVLIGRLLFQTYMFVYTQYIEPNWVNKVSEIWTQMMQEQGLSADQIDEQVIQFRKAYKPAQMFTIELVRYGVSQFILGVFASLLLVFNVVGRGD